MELREDFGAGTFRDEVEALGVFLGPSFIAFGNIARHRQSGTSQLVAGPEMSAE